MEDALKVYLKKDESGEWESRIMKYQKRVYESTKTKRKERKAALEAASKYDIVCRQCQTLITPAEELVKVLETNHHLLTGDYEQVITRKELGSEKNDHGDEVDRLNGGLI